MKFIIDFKKYIIYGIFKLRYLNYALNTHKQNINKNLLIEIDKLDKITSMKLDSILNDMCKGYVKLNNNLLYFMPIAVIDIRKGYESYLKSLSSNGRSKIKRAKKKGVECKLFEWNNHLDDIYEIHTSSDSRQGKKMEDEYLTYPKKIDIATTDSFKNIYVGAFLENKLVGYIELYIYSNFAMTNRLLGHKKFLNRYVMNALFAYAVEFLEDQNIEYLNYLTMHNIKKKTLSQFKKRLGFSEFSLKKINI